MSIKISTYSPEIEPEDAQYQPTTNNTLEENNMIEMDKMNGTEGETPESNQPADEVNAAQENAVVGAGETESTGEETTVDETETVTAVKKTRSKRTATPTSEAADESVSEAADESASEATDEDGTDESGDGEETVVEKKKPTMTKAERDKRAADQRRERKRKQLMNAVLDKDGRPIIDGDGTFDERIADIFRIKNSRSFTSGNITEVKQGRGGSEDYVEVMYNGFRVLIPFSEMDVEVERLPGDSDADYRSSKLHMIRSMLGAEIDFTILEVSIEDGLAGGSRLQANKMKRQRILNGYDRDGNYLVHVGRKCEARVLAVFPRFALLELFGMRVRLRPNEIRTEFVASMTDHLKNGDKVLVYITHLERDKSGNVTEMFVSMRNDSQEKRDLERAAQNIQIGDTCTGRVISRNLNSIFIRLSNGLQTLCYISNGLQGRTIPNVGDNVAVTITRKKENTNSGNPLMIGKIVRTLTYTAK